MFPIAASSSPVINEGGDEEEILTGVIVVISVNIRIYPTSF
jgi:hypothetical protein